MASRIPHPDGGPWPALEEELVRYVRSRLGDRTARWVEARDIAHVVIAEVLGDDAAGDLEESEIRARVFRRAEWRVRDAARDHQLDAGESQLPELDTAGHSRSTGSVTRRDDARWIRELITHLPPEYAEVVELCALEECSYAEAAERLGISAEAVRKRYERARERLTRKISERDG